MGIVFHFSQHVLKPSLDKIIEWCKHHKNDAPVADDEETERRTDDIPTWDQEFLKVDQGTLFELIMAANYRE